LQHIELNFNGLSEFVADDFYNLPLEYVNLSYQNMNEAKCTSNDGSVIEMYYQRGDPDNDKNIGFQGKFLEQIGRLQNLRHLELCWNSFSGCIPSAIGHLHNLGKALFSDSVYLASFSCTYIQFLCRLLKILSKTSVISKVIKSNKKVLVSFLE
jgi:hypothetical protein